MIQGKQILLVIAGGIAAYKTLELIRRLRERGASVRCVLTRAAQEFVTPLSVATLSRERVFSDLFSLTDEHEIGHIRLARDCDLVVVAPATADLITKVALGIADDLASTVLLVREGDLTLVVDPGMVAGRGVILEPLGRLGVPVEQVTDIVISHHHPDHTMNIALFPNARVHDVMAIYSGDVWQDRPAEGYLLSPSVRLIETPGHTAQDITTLVGTPDGVAAATHAWWTAEGPAEDPFASDAGVLSASRERILAVADLIVPGHGAPFRPDRSTPR